MSLRRLSRYGSAGLGAGLLAAWVWCSTAAAAEPSAKPIYDGTPLEELTKPPVMEMPPEWESPKRDKMVAEFMRKLGRLKPVGGNKKKDLEDYFLLATGDVDAKARNADVRFMVLKGLRKTAEFTGSSCRRSTPCKARGVAEGVRARLWCPQPSKWLCVREKGTELICAKHPPGLWGK